MDKPSNLSIEVNIPKKKDKNVMYSDRVFILAKERAFCRNSDDCTTVYATRKGFTGGADDITMQNFTLWADVAHPIFIGFHGNPEFKI